MRPSSTGESWVRTTLCHIASTPLGAVLLVGSAASLVAAKWGGHTLPCAYAALASLVRQHALAAQTLSAPSCTGSVPAVLVYIVQ
eukprot:6186180-Pleurochrysis_carterae.AAC.4